jgi:hypothetical protein
VKGISELKHLLATHWNPLCSFMDCMTFIFESFSHYPAFCNQLMLAT